MALASTLPTGSLADCGAKASTARASSAGIPRMRSTTRRAFRGVTRTYRAFALASITVSPFSSRPEHFCPGARGLPPGPVQPVRGRQSVPRDPGRQLGSHCHWFRLICCGADLATATAVIPDMAAERARRGELPELVADHRLGDEDRHVLAAVVHRDRVAQHRRNDHGASRPSLDHVSGALVVLRVHLLEQVVVNERALLQTTRHREVLLPLLLAAPAGDQPVAWLVGLPGAPLRLAPRAYRVTATRALALAATQRVINGVHRDTANRGTVPLPPVAACLAELDVALLGVADLADGGAAGRIHPPDLTRRHAQLRVPSLLGQQLDTRAGRTRDLGAATGPELDGVHHGAGRDVPQRQAVARPDVSTRPVLHPVPLGQARRCQDVALLAVGVVQQRDPGRAVGVVLQVRHLGRDAVLVRAAEVDQAVGALVAAARAPPARGRRLVLADTHLCSSSSGCGRLPS